MSKKNERLFFALWPDSQVRDDLSSAYVNAVELAGQGRRVTLSNLHITLHFLGNISLHRVACFIEQAQKVQSPSFQLGINQLGYFKKPKISWLGPGETPPALIQLQQLLGENIIDCGFQVETRPFRPHVTMARKINKAVPIDRINAINWKVDRFVLVQSITQGASVKYQVKASFLLN